MKPYLNKQKAMHLKLTPSELANTSKTLECTGPLTSAWPSLCKCRSNKPQYRLYLDRFLGTMPATIPDEALQSIEGHAAAF